ncbi:MAG TPA: hypothetical protein VE201_03055, partial [Nitrospirales bacterium]|nr:hypothetical protein [Nitrospirales bacterium]
MKTILRQRVMVNLLMVLGLAACTIVAVMANVVMAQTATEAPPVTSAPAPGGAPPAAVPAPPPKIDTGDTAWVLTSSALVLAMTAPGLALFYGGMVREKNALGTIMQSFIILCLISVQWVLWGYSLAFGPDVKGIVGSLAWMGLNGVAMDQPNADYAATIPHQAYMIFQAMFAVITVALITGAFAERM